MTAIENISHIYPYTMTATTTATTGTPEMTENL